MRHSALWRESSRNTAPAQWHLAAVPNFYFSLPPQSRPPSNGSEINRPVSRSTISKRSGSSRTSATPR